MILLAALVIGGLMIATKGGLDVGVTDEWTKYDPLFKRYASLNGFPWTWAKAIALKESDLGRDPRVVNKQWSTDGKSRGLMQLTVTTANDFQKGVTAEQLDDPETSIRIASQYLGFLYRRYSGDPMKTIMSYNQGQGNTDAGKTYAIGYYQKWQDFLNQVEENQ